MLSKNGTENVADIRTEMQNVLMKDCGVYRTKESLTAAAEKVAELKERYKNISVQDKGRVFNTDLVESIELGNLLDTAEATVYSALNRTESRGAHSREDFPIEMMQSG
jgi:succinate dehydrogenase / fumarate reductase flavoprotein subunit